MGLSDPYPSSKDPLAVVKYSFIMHVLLLLGDYNLFHETRTATCLQIGECTHSVANKLKALLQPFYKHIFEFPLYSLQLGFKERIQLASLMHCMSLIHANSRKVHKVSIHVILWCGQSDSWYLSGIKTENEIRVEIDRILDGFVKYMKEITYDRAFVINYIDNPGLTRNDSYKRTNEHIHRSLMSGLRDSTNVGCPVLPASQYLDPRSIGGRGSHFTVEGMNEVADAVHKTVKAYVPE